MYYLKWIVLIVLMSTMVNSKPFKSSKKLNVLFIIADDLNCALGSYGDTLAITPNLDELAKQGLIFTNAHVQYPLCGPSRVSLMTGLYPDQTKSKELRLYVRQTIPDVITLGQKFRMENYNSVRVGKIYHYHNPRDIGTSGHDDSFSWDRTVNPYGRDKIEEYMLNKVKPDFDGATLSWLQSDGKDEEQTDGIGASAINNFLDEFSESEENFFLAYGLFRPHIPFVAPKKYFDMYDIKDFSVPQTSDTYLSTIPKPAAVSVRSRKEQIDLDPNLAATIKHAYYATTTFMDAQIGRVIKKLKDTGLDKNTIIVFTSDHGYHLGDHGHWQKQTLFENATKVPLIFSGPGITQYLESVDDPVELIDIYPTIMDLTGMKTPPFVSGKSLISYFDNKKVAVRANALTELQVNIGGKKVQGYGIKTKRYRLNRWFFNGSYEYELYDHKYDSEELLNLAQKRSYMSVRDSLSLVLSERVKQARKKPNGIGRQFNNIKPINDPKKLHSKKR